jgi:hypothetical protein
MRLHATSFRKVRLLTRIQVVLASTCELPSSSSQMTKHLLLKLVRIFTCVAERNTRWIRRLVRSALWHGISGPDLRTCLMTMQLPSRSGTSYGWNSTLTQRRSGSSRVCLEDPIEPSIAIAVDSVLVMEIPPPALSSRESECVTAAM